MFDKKGVEKYICQCIRDAYSSESRKYKLKDIPKDFYYVVVEGKYLVFKICTSYERVNRHATYRIVKNFKKNFGLIAMTRPSDINCEKGYTLEKSDSLEVANINFTRNAFKLKRGNKESYVFLIDYRFLEKEDRKYIPGIVYERLEIARLGEQEFVRRLNTDEGVVDKPFFYDEFVSLFKEVFGWDVGLSITAHSDNLVEL